MYFQNVAPRMGLFAKLKNGINWGNFLTNTSKTLGVINQAIPIIYQVKPLVQNAKTMFKIADIIKSDDIKEEKKSPLKTNPKTNIKKEEPTRSSNGPTFFL